MKENYNLFPADCVVVEGYNRDAIYDLCRSRIMPIPKSLSTYLKSRTMFNKLISSPQNSIESEYKEFLLINEFVISVPHNQRNNFKEISTDWAFPYEIMVAEITVNSSGHQLQNILEHLSSFLVYKIVINVKDYKLLDSICNIALNYEFNAIQVFTDNIDEQLLQNYSLKFHNIDFINKDNDINNQYYNPEFTIGFSPFIESLNHNTGLNRRIYINENGQLVTCGKNTKKMIYELSLQSIKSEYQKYWNITKDQISICKICEFRRACLDKRIPLYHEEAETYYYSAECAYNPFISKFYYEENYRSIKSINIQLFSNNIDFNDEKLLNINNKIWG